MSDLISRQDAIDAIEQLWDWDTVDGIQTSTALRQVITDIKNIPSAQQWIPCSERLPEKKGFYLVTTEEREKATMGFYEDIWFKAEKVIAWMPLSEPYREETE